MGDRGQVKMADSGVYLYAHSSGFALPAIVGRVLARRKRWDDDSYLARMIFCEMVGDDTRGELGFGIDTQEHGDLQYPVVVVDCSKRMVTVGGVSLSFDAFIAAEKGAQ